ncbi:MAG: hypothetical protein KatS3mg050_0027 [Litorilinea sp.]|nr:MAG: hypothetical protein KatS3mg050_0027 [Litorilinea sp.]
MFPNDVGRGRPSPGVWLFATLSMAVALLAVLIYATTTTALAQGGVIGGTASGDFCIEGLVINHEEEPLAGWVITLTNGSVLTTTSAPKPDEGDDDALGEGEFEFLDLAPGTYTATIQLQPGWEPVTPDTFQIRIREGRDGCVRIRFKVRQIVEVTVYKIDANHNPLPNWNIEARPGPGNFFAEPVDGDTDSDGKVVFHLTPGEWIFQERPPQPEDDMDKVQFMPVVPPTGRQTLDVQPLGEGDPPYIIVFKNEIVNDGCVVIRKFGLIDVSEEGDLPGFATQTNTYENGSDPRYGFGAGGWGFKLLRKDGTVARKGVTDAEGWLRFENLPYGPYTVVEEERPGWTNFTVTQQDINVTSGECIYVPFENEQDDSGFCIEGRKVDANGGYGIPGWKITATPLTPGGYEPDDVYTDGLGEFKITFPRNDYRVPGATYEVCEEDQDGWLPHTPKCQRVTLPEWPGACVQLEDFVNQQVGHSESQKYDKGKMDWDMGKGCSSVYVAKKGDGLFAIGAKFGVPAQAMIDANPWIRQQPNYWLYAGQKVCIP